MMANPETGRPSPADTVAAEARSKKSSALFILACIFLGTGALRANDLRHDLVALLGSPAYAATDPAAGSHASVQEPDHGPKPAAEDQHAKSAARAADGAHSPAAPAMEDKAMPAASDPAHQTKPGDQSGPAMHGDTTGDMAKKTEDRCLTGAFLAAARERERELNAMALQVDSRKRELQVAEKRVAEQILELTTQQKALAAAFGQADATAEEEAMQLVAIYEKMKPKQASQIFDQMPPEIGAGFVRRMRQTSSAQIMANMDPQKAYAISLLLAGRSSAVRKQ
jgi:flagellar motility protein MotE (MotC chaperone)